MTKYGSLGVSFGGIIGHKMSKINEWMRISNLISKYRLTCDYELGAFGFLSFLKQIDF